MKPTILKVKTPGKMILVKGRLVRTPLETIVEFETELNLLKSSLILQGIEFEVSEYIPVSKKIEPEKEIINETPKKQKQTSEPKTTLEKIAAGIEE